MAAAGTQVDVHGEQSGGLKIAISGNSFRRKGSGGTRRRTAAGELHRNGSKRSRTDGLNFPKGNRLSQVSQRGVRTFLAVFLRRIRTFGTHQPGACEGGLRPLTGTKIWARAARYHANDMAHDAYFDHESYDRRDGRLIRLGIEFARIRRLTARAARRISRSCLQATLLRKSSDVGWRRHPIGEIFSTGANVRVGIAFCGGYWVQDFGW